MLRWMPWLSPPSTLTSWRAPSSTVNRCSGCEINKKYKKPTKPAELRSVVWLKCQKNAPFLNDENKLFFSCTIRHLVNDLSIFVSYAVPHNKTLFFFFLPESFYHKLYRYNFSKQISLSYKNRLFFFHKIIHIITFSVI